MSRLDLEPVRELLRGVGLDVDDPAAAQRVMAGLDDAAEALRAAAVHGDGAAFVAELAGVLRALDLHAVADALEAELGSG